MKNILFVFLMLFILSSNISICQIKYRIVIGCGKDFINNNDYQSIKIIQKLINEIKILDHNKKVFEILRSESGIIKSISKIDMETIDYKDNIFWDSCDYTLNYECTDINIDDRYNCLKDKFMNSKYYLGSLYYSNCKIGRYTDSIGDNLQKILNKKKKKKNGIVYIFIKSIPINKPKPCRIDTLFTQSPYLFYPREDKQSDMPYSIKDRRMVFAWYMVKEAFDYDIQIYNKKNENYKITSKDIDSIPISNQCHIYIRLIKPDPDYFKKDSSYFYQVRTIYKCKNSDKEKMSEWSKPQEFIYRDCSFSFYINENCDYEIRK